MDQSVEARPSVPDKPLDIEQIRLEAQNQWLSQSQICKILWNYEKFGVTSKLPNKPPSGSFFLFDKKVQKHFRNDGHNWTKKKDGRTLEAHQTFKDGRFGALTCYYATGEENRNFRRRSYWMLKGDRSHIVFVHYLEVTGKTKDSSCVKETQGAGPYSQETKDIMPNSEIDGSMHSSSHLNNCQVIENTDTWRNCLQALEHESAQSVDAAENIDTGGSDPYDPLFSPNSFHEILSATPCTDLPPTEPDKGKSDNDAELAHDLWTNLDSASWKDIVDTCAESTHHQSLFSSSRPGIMGKFFSNSVVKKLNYGVHSLIQKESKAPVEDSSSLSKQPMDQKLHSDSACDTTPKFHKESSHLELMNSIVPQQKLPDIRNNNSMENCFQTLLSNEEPNYALPPDSDECFNLEGKSIYSSDIEYLLDGIVTEGPEKRSSSGANGEPGENDVSSIRYEGTSDIQDINAAENCSDSDSANLLLRFDKILCSVSSFTNSVTSSLGDVSQLSCKISPLLNENTEEWVQTLNTGSGMEFSFEKLKEHLLQKRLKEKLHVWLVQKVAEGGKGPSVLDEGGQGVLHFAAALGYDWAFKPAMVAGVSVNFLDLNGWTALHWAAARGREHSVASLISFGADPGALTNPSSKYPSGRTPANLASASGHKRIARYLADRSLDVHISSINLDNQDGAAGPKAVHEISEISATPLSLGNASDAQSRKDSLATICDATDTTDATDATDAASDIHQVFQGQSSQKNKYIVLWLHLDDDDKSKRNAMKTVSTFRGIDSVSIKNINTINTKRKQLTMTGAVDPCNVVRKLRKYWSTELKLVKSAEERKKEEEKKQDKVDYMALELVKAYNAYNPVYAAYDPASYSAYAADNAAHNAYEATNYRAQRRERIPMLVLFVFVIVFLFVVHIFIQKQV